jgi:hypothetical protein
MNRLLSFLKKIRIGQILTAFIAGIALFLTACNPAQNVQGARPNNVPVQMGGNNNPHSMGGDGYTDSKMTTDPSVQQQPNRSRNHAALLNFEQLIAANEVRTNTDTLLYPGPDATNKSSDPTVGHVNPQVFDQQVDEIPAERQPVIDRSDPNVKILEKVGEAFKESSAFLKGEVEEGAEGALEAEAARRN